MELGLRTQKLPAKASGLLPGKEIVPSSVCNPYRASRAAVHRSCEEEDGKQVHGPNTAISSGFLLFANGVVRSYFDLR
jgi:hypothetical protein